METPPEFQPQIEDEPIEDEPIEAPPDPDDAPPPAPHTEPSEPDE